MKQFPRDLIESYKKFKTGYFDPNQSHYAQLAANGQNPETMVISCCDSRVDPETIFNCGPGELFVVRNVANLVPPFETQGSYHGVSAAIEFASLNLRVKNIIILGHSKCGGIRAALDKTATRQTEANFITKWMSILDGPKEKVVKKCGCESHDVQQYELEKDGIIHSLENLRSFPCIKALEEMGKIALYGAHYDISNGELRIYNQEINKFELA
jgi:carbonic anhydrase